MISIIVAGGKGTRLKNVFKKPKFLIKLGKKTILDRQISEIKKSKKIKKIFLSINNKNIKFINKKYIAKNKISLLVEHEELGTAGCLKILSKENFRDVLIIFGDLLLNFDFNNLINFHIKKKSDCTIVVHPNDHPYDSDMVKIFNNKIVKFYKKPRVKPLYIKNRCMSGIFIFKKKILKLIDKKKFDISKNLIPKIIKKKMNIFAFENNNFIKDVGTPERLIQGARIKKFNFYKRPAIFLDRDGVLNKEYKGEKFSNPLDIYSDVVPSLKLINKSKFLAIVITNQPSIAKGFISEKKLNSLHDHLEYKLGKKNVFLNDIFYCPHHPERGFKKEIKKLKIKCGCRKPNIDLIIRAQSKYNIDLANSFFIGNNMVDILTAKNAGLIPIIIRKRLGNVKYFKNLILATEYIIKK